MQLTSIIQVLKLDEARKGTSAKTGKAWERHTAQCMLLNDKGECEKVGVLDIPDALVAKCKPGIYRGAFALMAREYGDRRGLIEAVLTDLIAAQLAPAK